MRPRRRPPRCIRFPCSLRPHCRTRSRHRRRSGPGLGAAAGKSDRGGKATARLRGAGCRRPCLHCDEPVTRRPYANRRTPPRARPARAPSPIDAIAGAGRLRCEQGRDLEGPGRHSHHLLCRAALARKSHSDRTLPRLFAARYDVPSTPRRQTSPWAQSRSRGCHAPVLPLNAVPGGLLRGGRRREGTLQSTAPPPCAQPGLARRRQGAAAPRPSRVLSRPTPPPPAQSLLSPGAGAGTATCSPHAGEAGTPPTLTVRSRPPIATHTHVHTFTPLPSCLAALSPLPLLPTAEGCRGRQCLPLALAPHSRTPPMVRARRAGEDGHGSVAAADRRGRVPWRGSPRCRHSRRAAGLRPSAPPSATRRIALAVAGGGPGSHAVPPGP